MRNILIHEYFDVNWKRVWEVVAKAIGPLKENVTALLTSLDHKENH